MNKIVSVDFIWQLNYNSINYNSNQKVLYSSIAPIKYLSSNINERAIVNL